MIALSSLSGLESQSSDSFTPTWQVDNLTQNDPSMALNAKVSKGIVFLINTPNNCKKIIEREQHYCAISGVFDMNRTLFLRAHGRSREIPQHAFHSHLKVVYILPLKFNNPNPERIQVTEAVRWYFVLLLSSLNLYCRSMLQTIGIC